MPVDRAGCDNTGGCGDGTLPSCMFFSACSAPRGLLTLESGWSIGCDVTAVTKVRQQVHNKQHAV